MKRTRATVEDNAKFQHRRSTSAHFPMVSLFYLKPATYATVVSTFPFSSDVCLEASDINVTQSPATNGAMFGKKEAAALDTSEANERNNNIASERTENSP